MKTRGFTLIELMIVMSIMAVVMTMSAPAIYHIWHQGLMRKAVADVVEACSHARALAIMRGSMTELVFHAQDHTFAVAGAPAKSNNGDGAPPAELSETAPANAGLSGVLPDTVEIAVLKINGVNCMESDTAFVRFYPNGTCDELRLILMDQSGDFRGIFLEITTSLASVESDRYKLQSELR